MCQIRKQIDVKEVKLIMKGKTNLRRFMILLLSAALILSALPPVFAEEPDGAGVEPSGVCEENI